jgi:hypothetical protein
VELAQALDGAGVATVVQSICSEDFRAAIAEIVKRIGGWLSGTCLPRPLHPNPEGLVPCQVVETLPTTGAATRCAALADRGRTFLRMDGVREVCEIRQVASPGELGWFYEELAPGSDDCRDRPQRIAFAEGASPGDGAVVRLECIEPVQNVVGGRTAPGFGTACGTSDDCAGTTIPNLFCDPVSLTCQQGCTTDASCFLGLLCDAGRGAGVPAVCVNPTCTY